MSLELFDIFSKEIEFWKKDMQIYAPDWLRMRVYK